MNSKNTSASNKTDDYRSVNDPSTSKKLWPNNEPDYDAVDPSQNNCVMPQDNMYGSMNQWGAPVNSGMPGMGVASSNTSGDFRPDVVPPDPMPDLCMMSIPNGNATKNGAFPSPIVNYSECEAAIVAEQLQNEETFKQASLVLIHWLEVGECNQRNASTFYFMIQSMYRYFEKLVARKTKINDELQAVKNKLSQKRISNGLQFNDVENVFKQALMQKVRSHFTKAQQKCIDTWNNSVAESKNANIGDLLKAQMEEGMELCDEADKKPPVNLEKSQKKEELSKLTEEKAKLLEENELLHCQIRAATNELAYIKAEGDEKEAALKEAYARAHEKFLLKKRESEKIKEVILAMEYQENVSSEDE